MTQFPHCDQRVLHAPSDNCLFCNQLPDLQNLRVAWGIAFTGHSAATEEYLNHESGEMERRPLIPCPSEWARPDEIINRWHGNVPYTPEVEQHMADYYGRLAKKMRRLFGAEGGAEDKGGSE